MRKPPTARRGRPSVKAALKNCVSRFCLLTLRDRFVALSVAISVSIRIIVTALVAHLPREELVREEEMYKKRKIGKESQRKAISGIQTQSQVHAHVHTHTHTK